MGSEMCIRDRLWCGNAFAIVGNLDIVLGVEMVFRKPGTFGTSKNVARVFPSPFVESHRKGRRRSNNFVRDGNGIHGCRCVGEGRVPGVAR